MKIGIIVAMDKELRLLLPVMADISVVNANGYEFHLGKIGAHEVVAMKCGIGKVNAALGTLTMIENFHPALIVNSGVAGGTGAGKQPLQVLDVLLATRIAYHDVWCGPGTEPGTAAGCPAFFECPLPETVRTALGAREGLLASGDIFVDKVSDIERITELYPEALAVDMESAAIAQTCYIKCVPFVCLRVISDTPGKEGNAAAYNDFWTSAPERTFEAVEKLLAII